MKLSILLILLLSGNMLSYASEKEDINKQIKQAQNYMYTDISKAISFAESARLHAIEINDQNLLFDTNLLLGAIFSLQGNFDVALEYYLNSEEYLNENDSLQKAHFHLNMGGMYWNLEDNYKALNHANTALAIYKSKNDSLGLANVYNLLGLIYVEKEEYDKADKEFKSAIKLNRGLKNADGAIANLNNLTLVPGDEDRKIGYLLEAIRYNQNNNAKWALAENYNNMAWLYTNKKDYAEAKEYLNKANTLAKELDAKGLIIDNLNYASQIALAEERYKDAYDYLMQRTKIQKEILSKDKVRKIEEDALERRNTTRQYKLELAKKELKLARQNRRNIILLISASFIFIVLYVVLAHRKRVELLALKAKMEEKDKCKIIEELQKKEKFISSQEEQLNKTNRELTDLVYHIKSKEKLVDKIISMIRETYPVANDECKQKLKSITAYIKQYRDKEKQANLFVEHIEEVENRFLNTLIKLHPNLSKNEKTLATLLRIGLTSKEIAFLIDSTPKTVNMARYRLRKNLNLENDDNLVEYIAGIVCMDNTGTGADKNKKEA